MLAKIETIPPPPLLLLPSAAAAAAPSPLQMQPCTRLCHTSHLEMPQCTASAPGKVLVAGGYLVLVRPSVGVVVGMSARFTSTVAGNLIRNVKKTFQS